MVFDLNLDLGELDGEPARRRDLELLAYATRINVACGFHAGDEEIMLMLCGAARERGVLLGAHVGYRDRENFGRRELGLSAAQLARETVDQLRTLTAVAADAGAALSHVKPHGALYHRLGADREAARAVAAAIADEDNSLAVLTMPGSALAAEAEALGLEVMREGFADRSYLDAARLASREYPTAVLDPYRAAHQARALATAAPLRTFDGTALTIAVETICIHGDGPDAFGVARAVHSALTTTDAIPTIRPAGARALLVDLGGGQHPADAAALLRAGAGATLIDAVPGHETVLTRWSGDAPSVASVFAMLAGDAAGATDPAASGPEPIRLPVVYDGADLHSVAAATGLSPEGLIARHAAADYRVAFLGFLPGFAYLVGNDPVLQVPRHADPRPQVPAGSVALGGEYCGVYPRAAPGGWQLLGRTTAALFDTDRATPALLHSGAQVRFEAVRSRA